MNHMKKILNKGLELIRLDMVQVCQEIAHINGITLDAAAMNTSILLPASWDHFCTALIDVKTVTAHKCYMQWYKSSFRGKKCSMWSTLHLAICLRVRDLKTLSGDTSALLIEVEFVSYATPESLWHDCPLFLLLTVHYICISQFCLCSQYSMCSLHVWVPLTATWSLF